MVLRSMKAKQHYFSDTVTMADVLHPTEMDPGRQAAGTKVLITLGPSCQEEDTLVRMLEAGVTCARIDLTWGNEEFHRRSLANLNAAMQRTRRLCSVWLDTMGREMVVRRPVQFDDGGWGMLPQERIKAAKGQAFTVTTRPDAEASSSVFPINYPRFATMVEPGTALQVGRYLATGAEGASLFLEVKSKSGDDLECEAKNDAVLEGLLTVMICHGAPQDSRADQELPLLTQHDVHCMKTLGQEFDIDFISLSYCNSADDVLECRGLLTSLGMTQTKIIAKVEHRAALGNFVDIMGAADGILFSRGNLGLDFDPERMALLQKRAVSLCNSMGKPVILTRIVDTMVGTPRPTRAEATDVANAVLDGVDGVMLGAETQRGCYPVETVETVLRLAHSAEAHFDYKHHAEALAADEIESPAQSFANLPDLGESFGFGVSPTYALGSSISSPNLLRVQGGDAARESSPVANGGGGGATVFGAANGVFSPNAGSPQGSPPIGAVGSFSTLIRGPSAGEEASVAAGLPPRAPRSGSSGGDGAGGGLAAARAKPMFTSSFGNLAALGGSKAGIGAATPAGLGLVDRPSPERPRRWLAGLAAGAPGLGRVQKLESMAVSATRTAEKINAGLIVVMTQSGRTASLVAKYRPPMPILAVVVPTLRSDGLGWQLEGKFVARQCLVIRGVVPMLAAPMSEGSDDLLSEAIFLAAHQRLAKPNDYVVCILSARGALAVKVVQVNREGTGIKVMHEHANCLVTGDEPDLIAHANPQDYRAFVACPGAMTPRGPFSPGESPFGRAISFRGAAPFPLAAPEHFASLSGPFGSGMDGGSGGVLRGGPIVPASPIIRQPVGSPDSGPPPMLLSPVARQPSIERPPSAGAVLPLLGRRSSSVMTPGKYAGGGLPPLPPSPPGRAEQ